MTKQTKKPKECDACYFETDELEFFEYGIGFPDGSGDWLCKVCACTESGNVNRDQRVFKDPTLIKMIAYCTNMILEKIEQLKEIQK